MHRRNRRITADGKPSGFVPCFEPGGIHMTSWRSNPKSLKKRQQRKVKISWTRLGLRDPIEEKEPVPIEEMRRQVDVVAREGLMRGVRSYPTPASLLGGDAVRRRSRGKKA
jgi:hypothetical protein